MIDFKVLHEGLLLAERLGRKDAAASFLEKIEQLRRQHPETIAPRDDARYELTRIERLLYEPKPDGFRGALQGLEGLLTRLPAASKEPAFHVLRAAALGQQYAFEKGQGADDKALRPVIEQALAAIREARYAGQTDWLHSLADPTRGGSRAVPDDDLVEIARLPEVREALGM